MRVWHKRPQRFPGSILTGSNFFELIILIPFNLPDVNLGLKCTMSATVASGRGVCAWGVSTQGGVCLGGCLPGDVCPGGLPREGCDCGGVCSGGCLPRGVSAWGDVCETPPCEQNDWQTPVKILPCRNFVADGKNSNSHPGQSPNYWSIIPRYLEPHSQFPWYAIALKEVRWRVCWVRYLIICKCIFLKERQTNWFWGLNGIVQFYLL